jgi:hypothetical protein
VALTVPVTARKAFIYDGRPVARGERLWLAPLDAALRARRQEVSLSRVAAELTPDVVEPDPPSPIIDEPPPRRRYRRRDLEAEE